jgi:hypothetical protein
MKKITLLFAVLSIMFACNSSSTDKETTLENVETTVDLFNDLFQPNDGGLFRGADFDMSKDAVLALENSRSTSSIYKDEDPNELVITTDMGKEALNFADVTYYFDEQGLYSISVESYAISKEIADSVFEMVVEHLTKLYGEGELAEDGFLDFYGEGINVAVQNIDLEESFGMYIYFTLN